MPADVQVQDLGRDGHLSSSLIDGRSQHLSLLVQPKLHTMSNIWSWKVADSPLEPMDLDVFPRTW